MKKHNMMAQTSFISSEHKEKPKDENKIYFLSVNDTEGECEKRHDEMMDRMHNEPEGKITDDLTHKMFIKGDGYYGICQ